MYVLHVLYGMLCYFQSYDSIVMIFTFSYPCMVRKCYFFVKFFEASILAHLNILRSVVSKKHVFIGVSVIRIIQKQKIAEVAKLIFYFLFFSLYHMKMCCLKLFMKNEQILVCVQGYNKKLQYIMVS